MLYSLVMLRSIFWKPYSHPLIVSYKAGWALDEEARAMAKICSGFGLRTKIVKRVSFNIPHIVHYTSQFALLDERIYKSKHKISVDYFHGKGEQSENLKKCFKALKNHHERISRVRVSTVEMETFIKSSGINPNKVMRIPIGVDTDLFKPQTRIKKQEVRRQLQIPDDAVVIGSFQKDGVGWGDGNEPKLIKGPDIFIKVVEKLKQEIPNLWVLLSGPSRGYVKKELNRIGIPYCHQSLFYSILSSHNLW